MVARCELLTLQHEQADLALDAAGFAGTLKAVYRLDLHRNSQTHA